MGLGRGRQTSKLESLIVATISLAPIYFNGSLRHLLKLRDRCSGVQRADENLLRATPFSDASPISFPNSPRLSLLHPFPFSCILPPRFPRLTCLIPGTNSSGLALTRRLENGKREGERAERGETSIVRREGEDGGGRSNSGKGDVSGYETSFKV